MKTTLKLSLSFLFLLIFSAQTFAQGQERSVERFDKLHVSSAIDVKLRLDSRQSIALEGDNEALEKIEVFVRNGTLIIRRDQDDSWWKRWWKDNNNGSIVAYISTPALKEIEASGACDVTGEGIFKADDMRLEANGASDIRLEVEAARLDIEASGASDVVVSTQSNVVNVDCSGASDVRLKGSTNEFSAEASGASDVKAKELQTRSASVRASGAGSCYVAVSESIKANASGGSSVYYYGEPERVSVSSSGGGSIKKRSL